MIDIPIMQGTEVRMTLWVIGSGGHAKVVIDAARASGRFEVVGVLDDAPGRSGSSVLGVPVLGEATPQAVQRFRVKHAVIAVGSNRARAEIARRLDGLLAWALVPHPTAILARGVEVGEGSVIFAGAIVQPDSVVGRHAILNTACSVDHDGEVGDFAHIAPGARLAGGVRIGTGALLGIGSCVLPRCNVGEWATIGAGAVVVRDVPNGTTVVGVPACPIPQAELRPTVPAPFKQSRIPPTHTGPPAPARGRPCRGRRR